MKDAPTHICGVCGAFWWGDGSQWSLMSRECGKCCDGEEMGMQIVSIVDADEYAALIPGSTWQFAAKAIYVQRQADAESEARGSCAKCKHYTPDPEAGRRYFGEPNADSGWCKNPSIPSGHRDYPHADMLSGDWCQQFEARP